MFYAGIDAHAQYLRVAVVDKNGSDVGGAIISVQDPGDIGKFLAQYRPVQVVVETCPFWPWLRDALKGPDIRFHLAHSRELRAIAQHAHKSDRLDAELLARMLLTGLIPPAHAHAAAELSSFD